jgi:hypothetical protein
VKDKNGDLLAGSSNIVNRWTNYFSQILNVHSVSDVRQIEIHTAEPLVPGPSRLEIEIAIAKLKRRNLPGSDRIPAELIQAGGETVSMIHKLSNSVWNREELPDQWKESTILPVHIKGNKTDCNKLRVFENRVLRRIFGPKRDGVTGGWRKLHNEELHNLYSSPSIIRIIKSRRMKWAGHVARMGEKRNVYRLLVGKPEGKRPLGRPRRTWMDNIKMDLLEIGLNVVDWIGLAQDRYRWRALVNSMMNLRVS